MNTSQERPNVLWFHFDEMRADSLGCMGSDWAKTPHIDAIAKQGMAFTNCYCQAPVCLPSRTSQLASRYPWEIGALNNRYRDVMMPEGSVSFTEIFREKGYTTATFGKQHTMKGDFWDIEEVINCGSLEAYFFGFASYDNDEYKVIQRPGQVPLVVAGIYPDDLDNGAQDCVRASKAFVDNQKEEGNPFLLRVAIDWPHTPVYTPRPYDTLYKAESLPIPYETFKFDETRSKADLYNRELAKMDELSTKELEYVWTSYMGLCAYVDSCVGDIMDHLKTQGMDENLIVLVTADHGKMLGEWGMGEKGNFDDPSWGVPCILSGPGVPEGLTDDKPCQLLDTGVTVLSLAGLEGSIPNNYKGENLVTHKREVAFGAIRDDIFGDDPDRFRAAVRTRDYRIDFNYAMKGHQTFEAMDGNLFKVEDSLCFNNLFYEPEYEAIRDEMIKQFEDEVSQAPCDPRYESPEYFAEVGDWEKDMGIKMPKHRPRKYKL